MLIDSRQEIMRFAIKQNLRWCDNCYDDNRQISAYNLFSSKLFWDFLSISKRTRSQLYMFHSLAVRISINLDRMKNVKSDLQKKCVVLQMELMAHYNP